MRVCKKQTVFFDNRSNRSHLQSIICGLLKLSFTKASRVFAHRFSNSFFAGNEVLAHNAYAIYKHCIRNVLSHDSPDPGLECCVHMSSLGLRLYCVDIIHVNIEISCNCMEFVKKNNCVLEQEQMNSVFEGNLKQVTSPNLPMQHVIFVNMLYSFIC